MKENLHRIRAVLGMHPKNIGEKELITGLIKDDLTNIRLVKGLEALGLDSGRYYLRLSEIVFLIMGISDEGFYEKYLQKCNTVMRIDIFEHPGKLDELTLKLYTILLRKSKLQTIKSKMY